MSGGQYARQREERIINVVTQQNSRREGRKTRSKITAAHDLTLPCQIDTASLILWQVNFNLKIQQRFLRFYEKEKQKCDENVSVNRKEVSLVTKKVPMRRRARYRRWQQGVERCPSTSSILYSPRLPSSSSLLESWLTIKILYLHCRQPRRLILMFFLRRISCAGNYQCKQPARGRKKKKKKRRKKKRKTGMKEYK